MAIQMIASTGMPRNVVCPNFAYDGAAAGLIGMPLPYAYTRPRARASMPRVTMNGSSPRKATRKPLTEPTIPPMISATSSPRSTDGPPNRPAAITADRPSAEPTLMSMPPVRTTISSPSVTTPMIDICRSRLVMLVAPQKIEPRVIVATRSSATRM